MLPRREQIKGRLLTHGEAPFLYVKLIMAPGRYTLYRCAELPIARRGMKLVLGVYLALMLVHAATGFSALGWHAPATVLTYFGSLPGAFFAFFS